MERGSLLDLDTIRIDPALARAVPESLALRRGVLLIGRRDGALLAACRDVGDHAAIEALERAAGGRVVALAAEPESLRRALRRVFTARRATTPVANDDAAALVEEWLADAIVLQASDVHVECAAQALRVRLRIDGVVETHRELPLSTAAAALNRIKVLAGLDIAERRAPQDGRFSFEFGPAGDERRVDVRVAVIPTKHGERATMRLLALRADELALADLGMELSDLSALRTAVARPHGLVLLTGPTGSGKTTTLYGALRTIDVVGRNVLTLEDPVEYDVPGVSQTEVDHSQRMTFASGLRALLRHDPDVLLVGEIRDHETADVAVKASLTGHLVLSTLHTNSALGAVMRLCDMGVAPYLVAATLRLSLAQRLVRRLCSHCRAPTTVDDAQRAALAGALERGDRAFAAVGCGLCRGTGYSGRVGLFESFVPDSVCAELIAQRATEPALLAAARAAGMRALLDDAASKVRNGTTSIDETLRALEVG